MSLFSWAWSLVFGAKAILGSFQSEFRSVKRHKLYRCPSRHFLVEAGAYFAVSASILLGAFECVRTPDDEHPWVHVLFGLRSLHFLWGGFLMFCTVLRLYCLRSPRWPYACRHVCKARHCSTHGRAKSIKMKGLFMLANLVFANARPLTERALGAPGFEQGLI